MSINLNTKVALGESRRIWIRFSATKMILKRTRKLSRPRMDKAQKIRHLSLNLKLTLMIWRKKTSYSWTRR
jgi:hypothetical protein